MNFIDFIFSVGAKRDSSGVISYLLQFKDELKEATSDDAKKFPIPVITFLETKIVWQENSAVAVHKRAMRLVDPPSGPKKVICKFNVNSSSVVRSMLYNNLLCFLQTPQKKKEIYFTFLIMEKMTSV